MACELGTSQTFKVHVQQEAKSVPSGLNFTADIEDVCPRIVCRSSYWGFARLLDVGGGGGGGAGVGAGAGAGADAGAGSRYSGT